MTSNQNYLAVIKVVGIGGGGVNAVNRMIDLGLRGVEFIAINTDAQALLMSDADVKLDVGRELTRGLGAGADPEVGRRAAEDHAEEIEEALARRRHGLRHRGRGRRHRHRRRTGRRPDRQVDRRTDDRCRHQAVLASRASAGSSRPRPASRTLKEEVDTLIVVPNDRLLEISDRGISMIEAFATADQVLLAGVQGITDLITTPGLINLDFADVKSVMQGAGSALMGIGSARGADRAIKAAELAVESPLLEASIEGAHGVLLSIQGGSNLGIFEINDAAQLVKEAAHPEANIIFGTVIDDTLGDEVRVTVIAAGFDGGEPQNRIEPSRRLARVGAAAGGAVARRSRASARSVEQETGVGRSVDRRELRLGVRRRRPRHPRLPEVSRRRDDLRGPPTSSRGSDGRGCTRRAPRRRRRGASRMPRARPVATRRDHAHRRDEVPPGVARRELCTRSACATSARTGSRSCSDEGGRASATLRTRAGTSSGRRRRNKATRGPGVRGIRRPLGRPAMRSPTRSMPPATTAGARRAAAGEPHRRPRRGAVSRPTRSSRSPSTSPALPPCACAE